MLSFNKTYPDRRLTLKPNFVKEITSFIHLFHNSINFGCWWWSDPTRCRVRKRSRILPIHKRRTQWSMTVFFYNHTYFAVSLRSTWWFLIIIDSTLYCYNYFAVSPRSDRSPLPYNSLGVQYLVITKTAYLMVLRRSGHGIDTSCSPS
jgi:hypothetical protein